MPPYSGPVPVCLLVRHGHSTANAEGVLAGWTPGIALTERGQEQVVALGERLRPLPVVHLVSSPLQRCVETADALLAARDDGLTRVEEEALGECRYGAWTGRPLKDLAQEPLWRTVQGHPSAAAFPDGEEYAGESLREMSARSVGAVRRIDAAVASEHGNDAIWVAVTHGDIIKAVLAEAAGTHLDLFQRFQADPATVSAVRYTAARPFVVSTNDNGGDLGRLVPPPRPETPSDGEGAAEPGSQGPEPDDAVVGGGAGHEPSTSAR